MNGAERSMVNLAFSQLSIAATLLNGATEQIADAAEYLDRAGDQPSSHELRDLNAIAQKVIGRVEAKLLQTGVAPKKEGAPC